MMFSPHILQKLVVTGAGIDENGNPQKGKEDWIDVGGCRCDDNDAQQKISVNGVLHDYNYHVVYEGDKMPIGTKVRVLDSDGEIRGEGSVIRPKKCNYFAYSEIWL